MTVLDALNFVTLNPLKINNPIAVPGRKLIAKVDEKIQLVTKKSTHLRDTSGLLMNMETNAK